MLTQSERFEMELRLLGTLIADKDLFFEAAANGFCAEIFSHNFCKLIASAMSSLYSESKIAPDPAALYQFMFFGKQADDDLKKFFTKNFLDPAICLSNIRQAIIILHEHASVDKFDKLAKSIQTSKLMGMDFLVHAQEKLSEIIYSHYGRFTGQVSNIEVAEELMKDIQSGRSGNYSDYIPTGFKYLDRKVIGIHKKSLTIIAARPSIGKTAFMLQLKRNWNQAGYKVGIFSLEMDHKRLMIRDLSEVSGINSMKIQHSKDLTDAEFDLLAKNITKVADEMYVVDDNPYQTAESIITKAHNWKVTGKADILMIDYLGLIKIAEKKGYDDKTLTRLIGEITTALRIFAKETSTPVIAFAQLNRGVEARNDKRPIMSDLRDSGNIEQDANTIMLLFRPDYYFARPPEGLEFAQVSDSSPRKYRFVSKKLYTKEGDACDYNEYFEIIVSKQRDGNVGTVPLRYLKHLHRFETLEYKHAEDPATNRILSETEDPF